MAHITVGTTSTRADYTASASQTAFSVPFEFFDEDDLLVYKNNVLLTKTTNYTVTPVTTSDGGFDGGTVTLTSGAASGDKIAIVLSMPYERSSDFPTAGPFNVTTLNTTLDKNAVRFKQLDELSSRAIKGPVSEGALEELPKATDRASRIMSFDSSGNPTTVATDSLSLATLQAFTDYRVTTATGNGSTTAFTLSADPGQEGNTQVYIDGIYQSKSNYSISGTTLTFSTAPPNTSAIEIVHGQAAGTYIPPDNTIAMEKILTSDIDTDLSSVSGSDDTLPSAKAVKTYVDAQVTAQDLDFQADSGGALNIDLDSESLTLAGGTGIDTVGSGNTVTTSIDSTVATLTGSQTLTNKSLTAPTVTGTAAFTGNVGINDASPNANAKLTVTSDATGTSGSMVYQSVVRNSAAHSTTPKSGTMYQFKYTGSTYLDAGGITVKKENATDGQYGTTLGLHTRANGGNLIEQLTIQPDGDATFAGDINMSASKMLNFADDMGIQWVDNKITGSNTHDTLYFLTNSAERMRVNSSGLAIGGSASAVANSKFEVSSATTVLPTVTVTADDQVVGWRLRRTGGSHAREWYMGMRENTSALDIYDNTANASRFHINASGEVAIGGGSALNVANHFTVDIAAASRYVRLTLDNNSTGARQWSLHSIGDGDSACGSFGIYDDTANAWRQRIDTSGNLYSYNYVAIGQTTTPIAKLTINGNSDSVAALRIAANDTHGWAFFELATGGHLQLNRHVAGTYSQVMLLDRSNGNATFAGDLHLDSDAAVLKFGDDAEITLTHVHNAGVSLAGNLYLPDHKSINIGTSNDLSLFHDTNDSHIVDQGTGNFYVKTNGTAIRMETYGGDDLATFTKDGSVELFYDDSKKIETTSTGVSVTGNVVATGEATFGPGGTGTDVVNVIANGGSGAAGGAVFEVRSNGTYRGGLGNKAALLGSGTSTDIELRAASGIPITFAPNNTDAVLLSTSGNMHIGGTSAPASKLLVTGDAEFTRSLSGSPQIVRVKNSSNTANSHARLILQNGGSSGGDVLINMDATASNARWSMGVDVAGKFVIADADKGAVDGSDERLVIDGASGGVGIGIAPDSTYALKVSKAGANSYHQLYGATGYAAEMHLTSQNASGTFVLAMDNAGTAKIGTNINTPLLFQTNNTEWARITSGKLAIGNTAPEANLDISGDTVLRSTGQNTNGRYWQYVRGLGNDPTNVDIVDITLPNYCIASVKVRVAGRGGAALATQFHSEQTYAITTDTSSANVHAGTQVDIDQSFTLTTTVSSQNVTIDVTAASCGNVVAYVEILSSATLTSGL